MDAIDTYMTIGSLSIAAAAGFWEKGFIFVPIALCVSSVMCIGMAVKEHLGERRTQWKRRK